MNKMASLWCQIVLCMTAFSVINGQVISGLGGLVADDAKLTKISDQFIFTEGPTADKAGNVYFTDQPNNKIWKYDTNGQLTMFMDEAGRANGLYFDNDGYLIACADGDNEMWRIDAEGKKEIILKGQSNQPLNGPNDVWVAPNGNFYFTDPYYHRPYWNRIEKKPAQQNVYLMINGKGTATKLDSTLLQPNGIIGSADGKCLYVADIVGDKTYKYKIGKGGKLTERKLFVNQGSDGMILDKFGNLYLTGNGVNIYNKEGKKLGHIDIPSNWTGNICFSGKDHKTLFITASESIYTLKMKVSGQ